MHSSLQAQSSVKSLYQASPPACHNSSIPSYILRIGVPTISFSINVCYKRLMPIVHKDIWDGKELLCFKYFSLVFPSFTWPEVRYSICVVILIVQTYFLCIETYMIIGLSLKNNYLLSHVSELLAG